MENTLKRARNAKWLLTYSLNELAGRPWNVHFQRVADNIARRVTRPLFPEFALHTFFGRLGYKEE